MAESSIRKAGPAGPGADPRVDVVGSLYSSFFPNSSCITVGNIDLLIPLQCLPDSLTDSTPRRGERLPTGYMLLRCESTFDLEGSRPSGGGQTVKSKQSPRLDSEAQGRNTSGDSRTDWEAHRSYQCRVCLEMCINRSDSPYTAMRLCRHCGTGTALSEVPEP